MGKRTALAFFAVGWHCSTNTGTGTMATLFQELTAAGCEIDNHESDLFVKDSPVSRNIIRRRCSADQIMWNNDHCSTAVLFRSTLDNEIWWDIPFAYDPFWQK